MGIPSKIILSGESFIKYIDDLSSAKTGDVLLYLNDDKTSINPGDYGGLNTSGYVKAMIFEGGFWHPIDITEFCFNKENKFSKKQRAIDSVNLCKDIMTSSKSIEVFKTYRGHFTRYKYEQGEYFRKANQKHKRRG